VRTIYNGGYAPTLALEDDRDSPWHGWLFFKHPDGEMVSLAKIEEVSEAPADAAPDSQKLISRLRESLEIQERKIERLRELLQKASDYKDYLQSPEESPVWIWQGDGEDYPDSMANSLTVVIRADQLRTLIHAVPDGAENALQAVRGVLERAYNSAGAVCCGRAGSECCGCPEPEWSEYDQRIMNDLGPVEKWLSAMLATAHPAKHTRSTLPDGVTRVRNVATGEITERRAVPDGYVLVPVEPTVTTEMKIDCIGEFSWKEEAPYYDENGIVHDYVAQHVVPWDICKDIFKRMYSHLVKECQLAAAQQGGEQ